MKVLGQAPGGNDTLEAIFEAGAFVDLTGMKVMPLNPYTSVVLRSPEQRRLLNLTRTLPPLARKQSLVHHQPLILPVPFPQVFASSVSSDGSLEKGRDPGQEVESCPMVTRLHAAMGAGKCEALQRMSAVLKRTSVFAAMRQRYGVEADEIREVLEVVTDHMECAADSSDDDDDISE
ncbi:unnamed protein product [Effrenium voratum]|nr:unnamed protein product [Effrenium voratum]